MERQRHKLTMEEPSGPSLSASAGPMAMVAVERRALGSRTHNTHCRRLLSWGHQWRARCARQSDVQCGAELFLRASGVQRRGLGGG